QPRPRAARRLRDRGQHVPPPDLERRPRPHLLPAGLHPDRLLAPPRLDHGPWPLGRLRRVPIPLRPPHPYAPPRPDCRPRRGGAPAFDKNDTSTAGPRRWKPMTVSSPNNAAGPYQLLNASDGGQVFEGDQGGASFGFPTACQTCLAFPWTLFGTHTGLSYTRA